MQDANNLRQHARKKGSWAAKSWHVSNVGAPRGALDGEALGLERSPAATTTPPLFDAENDILPILQKMLFKPNFHSP